MTAVLDIFPMAAILVLHYWNFGAENNDNEEPSVEEEDEIEYEESSSEEESEDDESQDQSSSDLRSLPSPSKTYQP